MARNFDGINDRLFTGSTPITSPPFTMAAWFRSTTITAFGTIIQISSGTQFDDWRLAAAGNSGGDPVSALADDPVFFGSANTSSGYSVNTWHHAAGVFASSSSRSAFIDGGSKGTNTVSVVPSNADHLGVGEPVPFLPGWFSGRIAEAACWNVALTDAEVATLAAGVSPLRVRPLSLQGYWPIFGASAGGDFSGGGTTLTVSGATDADHAPVSPMFGFGGMDPDAAPPPPTSGQPFRMRGMMVPGFAGGRLGRVA